MAVGLHRRAREADVEHARDGGRAQLVERIRAEADDARGSARAAEGPEGVGEHALEVPDCGAVGRERLRPDMGAVLEGFDERAGERVVVGDLSRNVIGANLANVVVKDAAIERGGGIGHHSVRRDGGKGVAYMEGAKSPAMCQL